MAFFGNDNGFSKENRDYDDHPRRKYDAKFRGKYSDFKDSNWDLKENEFNKSTKICRNGPNCRYFRQDICRNFHPSSDYQNLSDDDSQSEQDTKPRSYNVNKNKNRKFRYDKDYLYDKNQVKENKYPGEFDLSKLDDMPSFLNPSFLEQMNGLSLSQQREGSTKEYKS